MKIKELMALNVGDSFLSWWRGGHAACVVISKDDHDEEIVLLFIKGDGLGEMSLVKTSYGDASGYRKNDLPSPANKAFLEKSVAEFKNILWPYAKKLMEQE